MYKGKIKLRSEEQNTNESAKSFVLRCLLYDLQHNDHLCSLHNVMKCFLWHLWRRQSAVWSLKSYGPWNPSQSLCLRNLLHTLLEILPLMHGCQCLTRLSETLCGLYNFYHSFPSLSAPLSATVTFDIPTTRICWDREDSSPEMLISLFPTLWACLLQVAAEDLSLLREHLSEIVGRK